MSKYQQYFQEMVEYNAGVFTDFKALSEKYTEDPISNQEELNELGEKVLRIVRRYENMLCGKSENSGYGKYSSNLSDKFWGMVREYLPEIDDVGKS
jgi:hypothetical protein